MKKVKSTEKHIKEVYTHKLQVTTSSNLDKRVLTNSMNALEELKNKNSAHTQPNIWRIIMKSRITKLAAAAVIIIAVLIGINQFGGSIDGSSVAWGELVERLERSHDEYMKELLLAVKEKDTEKVNFYADLLDEFWQKLNWLARAELDPEFRIRMSAMIAEEKAIYDKREESDQIGTRIFFAYSDQFSDWLGKIEDVAWINEIVHVCHQMEEYAEEIRDGAMHSELDFSYVDRA